MSTSNQVLDSNLLRSEDHTLLLCSKVLLQDSRNSIRVAELEAQANLFRIQVPRPDGYNFTESSRPRPSNPTLLEIWAPSNQTHQRNNFGRGSLENGAGSCFY